MYLFNLLFSREGEDNISTFYKAQAFSPATRLTQELLASDTIAYVEDVALLPEAPNLLSLGEYGDVANETILYNGKDVANNALTGLVRAVEGTASTFAVDTSVARVLTAKDINDLQEGLGDKAETTDPRFPPETGTVGNVLKKTDDGSEWGEIIIPKPTHGTTEPVDFVGEGITYNRINADYPDKLTSMTVGIDGENKVLDPIPKINGGAEGQIAVLSKPTGSFMTNFGEIREDGSMVGDFNGKGTVDSSDVLQMTRKLAGLSNLIDTNNLPLDYYDFDKDGILTPKDIWLIDQYIVNKTQIEVPTGGGLRALALSAAEVSEVIVALYMRGNPDSPSFHLYTNVDDSRMYIGDYTNDNNQVATRGWVESRLAELGLV